MKKSVIVLAALLLFSSIGFAQTKKPKKKTLELRNAISSVTGLSLEEVNGLRAKKYNYGEIFFLAQIMKVSSRTLKTVAAEKDSGKGWKDISAGYGRDFESVRSQAIAELEKVKKKFKSKKQYKKAKNNLLNIGKIEPAEKS